jgi:hypothetical protein
MWLGSPRLRGIHEHLERVRLLFGLAQENTDEANQFRLIVTAIYSCRAISELMLEAAEKQEVKSLKDPDPKSNRDALEDQIAPKIPFYYLIERIRIHDFHRFGIVPPNRKYRELTFGGPMRLVAQKGSAVVSVTPQGAVVSTTGGSRVKLQRPLLVQDGQFFDEEQQRFFTLEEVLRAFLDKAPEVVAEFESFMA